MAVQGLWNPLGVNLPDLGVSEWLNKNIGTNITNNALVNPAYASEPAPPAGTTTSTPVSSVPGYSLTAPVDGGTQLSTPTQPGGAFPQQVTTQPVNTNPTPQPQNNTLSFDDIYNKVYPGWGRQEAYNDWVSKGSPQPTIGTGDNGQLSEQQLSDQLTGDLNSAYNPAMEVLGQQENYLREAQPGAEQGIQDQFALRQQEQSGDLASAKEQGTLDQRKLWDQKQNVLDASRQLYSELRMGANQRFGRASSAGEASNILLGREQQKQQGQTQRTYMNNMAELQSKQSEVDRSYKQNVAQLTLAKDEAIRKSQDTFKAGLMQIMSSKAGLETEKGLRRLDLLTDLRNSVMKAQQTAQEWTQKLDYQKEVSSMEFAYRLKEIQAQASYKTYAPVKSSYSVVDYNGTDQVMDKSTGQFTGNLQGQISSDEDEFDNWLRGA